MDSYYDLLLWIVTLPLLFYLFISLYHFLHCIALSVLFSFCLEDLYNNLWLVSLTSLPLKKDSY